MVYHQYTLYDFLKINNVENIAETLSLIPIKEIKRPVTATLSTELENTVKVFLAKETKCKLLMAEIIDDVRKISKCLSPDMLQKLEKELTATSDYGDTETLFRKLSSNPKYLLKERYKAISNCLIRNYSTEKLLTKQEYQNQIIQQGITCYKKPNFISAIKTGDVKTLRLCDFFFEKNKFKYSDFDSFDKFGIKDWSYNDILLNKDDAVEALSYIFTINSNSPEISRIRRGLLKLLYTDREYMAKKIIYRVINGDLPLVQYINRGGYNYKCEKDVPEELLCKYNALIEKCKENIDIERRRNDRREMVGRGLFLLSKYVNTVVSTFNPFISLLNKVVTVLVKILNYSKILTLAMLSKFLQLFKFINNYLRRIYNLIMDMFLRIE